MFKRIKVGSKIALFVSFLVFLSMVLISFLSYNFTEQVVRKKYLDDLVTVNQLQAKGLEDFYQLNKLLLEAIAQTPEVYDALSTIPYDSKYIEFQNWYSNLSQIFEPYLNVKGLLEVSIIDNKGQSIYSSMKTVSFKYRETIVDQSGYEYLTNQAGIHFGGIHTIDEKEQINAYSFIKNQDQVYYLVLRLDGQPLVNLLENSNTIGETAESVVARKGEERFIFVTKPRLKDIFTEFSGGDYGDELNEGMQLATKGIEGVNETIDYRGEKTLAAWTFIPGLKWGLVTKIDQKEINDQLFVLLKKLLFTGIILVLLSYFLSWALSKYLMVKLDYLKRMLQYLAKGILPNSIEKKSEDEFGEMAETVGEVVQSLKNTAEFAFQIGEGNYDTDFKPQSDRDILGASLIEMRNNIQASDERDDERNWIVSGVAEVGSILRQYDKLEVIGDHLLEYVTNRIGAIQGAFFVVDEVEDKELLNLRSCYAYQKKKHVQTQFQFAEGLVGQAAAEKELIFRTEIPRDYVFITSGLIGDQRPESILLVPLITDEKVFGVFELAAFHKLTERQVNFVQEISLIIARTIFNIKVSERTVGLLKESQTMSQELREKQEILSQNAEEMQSTQEELKRTNSQLEEQVEEVNRGQKRTQMLLENASEVITIYEQDGKVRYVSPSVERILGYTQEEMKGRILLHDVFVEDRDKLQHAFQELVLNPHRPMSIQYRVEQQDGKVLWVEATGNNLLSNPAIQGIVVNTRDITVRLRAEREERMRSKMQSLSENSLDLIARIDVEGMIFYINPTIKSLTGKPASSYLNKQLRKSDIPVLVINAWDEVLQEVKSSKKKIAKEIDFPTMNGNRIMQLNAIPEFDTDGEIESVLVVSHDITEQKLIELEIKSKNKKITESINYARRIQGAILPDEKQIHKQLPDSFIVYKARDVVSGDFPWYLEVDDQIFIAAVDCTGHGVPGALISLIGYFLLNDIVRSQKVSDPGQILDLLDQEVTKTLRQEEEGATGKDGMDIALCKIDKKSNTVEFAGAHRPLFWVRNGRLQETKGNKFPIGGGRYRNQTNFDSHKIQVEQGDAIYFCSDGYIDQFGGDQNRKFGSRRLRQLITDISSLEMEDQYKEFSGAWENWRGEEKQTDDMLLIGIKF